MTLTEIHKFVENLTDSEFETLGRIVRGKQESNRFKTLFAFRPGQRVRVNLGPGSRSKWHGQYGIVTKLMSKNIALRLESGVGLRVNPTFIEKVDNA